MPSDYQGLFGQDKPPATDSGGVNLLGFLPGSPSRGDTQESSKGPPPLPSIGAIGASEQQAKQYRASTPMTPSPQDILSGEAARAAKTTMAKAPMTKAAAADPKSAGPNLLNYATWQKQMDAWRAKYGNTAAGKAAWTQYQTKYGNSPYLKSYLSGTKGAVVTPAAGKLPNYTAWAERMNQWMAKYGKTPAGQQALKAWKTQNIGNPYATAYVNTIS